MKTLNLAEERVNNSAHRAGVTKLLYAISFFVLFSKFAFTFPPTIGFQITKSC